MKVPLQLDRYFFTKVEVEAYPDYRPSEDSVEEELKLQLEVGVARHTADSAKFQLTLDISGQPAGHHLPPYRFCVQAVGQFTVSEEVKASSVDKIIQVNGASMLYSAARELVLSLTSRGPWLGFQLPTVSFLDFAPKPVKRASPIKKKS